MSRTFFSDSNKSKEQGLQVEAWNWKQSHAKVNAPLSSSYMGINFTHEEAITIYMENNQALRYSLSLSICLYVRVCIYLLLCS
jgi:hypothetical protein